MRKPVAPKALKNDVKIIHKDGSECQFNDCRTKFIKIMVEEIEVYEQSLTRPFKALSHYHVCDQCETRYKTRSDKEKDKAGGLIA